MKASFVCLECGSELDLDTDFGWDGSSQDVAHYNLDIVVCRGELVPENDPRTANVVRKDMTPEQEERLKHIVQGSIDNAAREHVTIPTVLLAKGPFPCPNCAEAFNTAIELAEHRSQHIVVDHVIAVCKGCRRERTFYPDAHLVGAPALLDWMKTLTQCDCGAEKADLRAHIKNADALGLPKG
jgi:hypothetical protein